MKRGAALVALLAFAVGACAFATLRTGPWPADVPAKVIVTPEAQRAIDALARRTLRSHREQAACVTDFALARRSRDSVLVGLIALGPSAAYDSDSLRVWTRNGREFCAPGVPNVHTHVTPNEVWGRPSAFDSLQAVQWPTVPFRVLVSVSDTVVRVSVYALKVPTP